MLLWNEIIETRLFLFTDFRHFQTSLELGIPSMFNLYPFVVMYRFSANMKNRSVLKWLSSKNNYRYYHMFMLLLNYGFGATERFFTNDAKQSTSSLSEIIHRLVTTMCVLARALTWVTWRKWWPVWKESTYHAATTR